MLTIILIYSILIFPIFFGANISFSLENKKTIVNIKLFGVKVFSFYICVISDGIIIHLTKNYAVIIPFNKLLSVRKKVEPLKDYHVIRFNSTLDIASEDNPLIVFSIVHVLSIFYECLTWFLACHKPYVEINNITNVNYNKNELRINVQFTVVFNILMIILSLIKIIVGKVNYAIKK